LPFSFFVFFWSSWLIAFVEKIGCRGIKRQREVGGKRRDRLYQNLEVGKIGRRARNLHRFS